MNMTQDKTPATVPVPHLRIIYLVGGPERLIHVFGPALQHRLATKGSLLPTICVREGNRMTAYERIDVRGGSTLAMLPAPVAGTAGRGRVVLQTRSMLNAWTYLPGPVPTLDIDPNASPDDILRWMIALYEPLAPATTTVQRKHCV